jgi:membrane fusion protein, multidrug efflux system
MSSNEETPRPPKPRRVLLLLCGVAVGAIALVVSGVTDRAKSRQEVAEWTNTQAMQPVRLIQPQRSAQQEQLVLPGNVNAYNFSSLFARANGYVTAWHKDIGAHVTKGEVLATISEPDLDQQYAEAKAQFLQLQAAVQQAQANADLGNVTDQRTSRLVVQGWSSKEQGDTDRLTAASRVAALAVAKANVQVQQAAVNQLEELTRFEQITAPFDGVITARNVNIGDLVSSGNTTGRPLFQVADLHRMRIYVNVPQAFFPEIKPGTTATLHLPGQSETFEAQLASTSNGLIESSRTVTVELQTDNPDGKLLPGAFTEVHFHIPSDPNTLRIPATALIFGPKGMSVAAVDANNTVTLKTVALGRNLGNDVEVESGLLLSDRLIDNPQESTQQGEVVQVAGEKTKSVAVATSRKPDSATVKSD